MGKRCPQLGSTWPRSVLFWKVKLTYFPVICQYLTLIWQQKKALGTASHGVCFLLASLDDTLFGTISFLSLFGSERHSEQIFWHKKSTGASQHHINTITHTFIHWRQRLPSKVPPAHQDHTSTHCWLCPLGQFGVQWLVQGHFSSLTAGIRNQTTNLLTLLSHGLQYYTENSCEPHNQTVNYLHKERYENYLSIYQHYNAWHAKCGTLLTVTVQNVGLLVK